MAQAAAKVDALQTPVIKMKEELKNLSRKLSAEKNNLAKQEEEKGKHEAFIQELDNEIAKLEQQESKLVADWESLKRSQNEDEVVLTEEQEAEYEQVREAAAVASAKSRSSLHQVKEKLEAARRKAGDIKAELKEVTAKKEESINSVNALDERREALNKVKDFVLVLLFCGVYSFN
jgi:chromosome segregation ATPase